MRRYGQPMRATSTFCRGEWLVALGVAAYGQLEMWLLHPTHVAGSLGGLALSVAASALVLLVRRRYPMLVQVLVVAVIVLPWAVWGASESGAALLALTVATYSVGRYGRRPAAYLGVPIAVGAIILQLVLDPLQSGLADSWGWMLYGPALWGTGAWIRQRDDLELHREVERCERQRAALAEHRAEIARELHDILAHSLGAMVLQAEAAEAMLDRDPERARRPLHHVQETGRDALQEIRALLAVLRTDDPWSADADSALAALDPLVARLRDAGLPVALDRRGTGEMPPEVARAVYRVTQEALTNVVRHAGAVPTRVLLSVAENQVTLDIEDDGVSASTGATGGRGLVGIRERVAACGGTVAAGPTDAGGFAVRAQFPLSSSPRR